MFRSGPYCYNEQCSRPFADSCGAPYLFPVKLIFLPEANTRTRLIVSKKRKGKWCRCITAWKSKKKVSAISFLTYVPLVAARNKTKKRFFSNLSVHFSFRTDTFPFNSRVKELHRFVTITKFRTQLNCSWCSISPWNIQHYVDDNILYFKSI
jgi:hypothetical protein